MSVVISDWDYKEYQGLIKQRDNELDSLRAQLKIQNAEAIKEAAAFARMVVKMIEENFDIKRLRAAGSSCSIVAVYDAANEIIAQE